MVTVDVPLCMGQNLIRALMCSDLLMDIGDEPLAIGSSVKCSRDRRLRCAAFASGSQCSVAADGERYQRSSARTIELLVGDVQCLSRIVVGDPTRHRIVGLGRAGQC